MSQGQTGPAYQLASSIGPRLASLQQRIQHPNVLLNVTKHGNPICCKPHEPLHSAYPSRGRSDRWLCQQWLLLVPCMHACGLWRIAGVVAAASADAGPAAQHACAPVARQVHASGAGKQLGARGLRALEAGWGQAVNGAAAAVLGAWVWPGACTTAWG